MFVTSTVVAWVDGLSREWYKEIICDSLRYCCVHKGLRLHAWVIMSNHFHLIISAQPGYKLSHIMRDLKKHTSRKVVEAIMNNPQESRKNWMLNMFGFYGKTNSNNEENQFWQEEYHPIMLDTQEKLIERFNYLHNNPVSSGLVWLPQHYKYSSAIDYLDEKPGLLPLDKLII